MLKPDVALVSMPFGPVFAPSIGLSLLRAELAEHQLSARIHYFTIRFAQSIGQAFYSEIAEGRRPVLEDLAGEWLFSGALFGTTPDYDDTRYVKELLEDYYPDALITRLRKTRERIDSFLDGCLGVLLRDEPRVIGFTSMFQQHTASLALARRLKEASPSTFIVFGGPNCEGIMGAETVRSFPFVDAAISGEADLVFPQLVRRVLDGASVAGLPGVRSRDSIEREFATAVFTNGPMVREMDSLPLPDYSDYFEQFESSPYHRGWQPYVFLETSRGCWWGERMHCTFCGLNGATMTFRSKSADRALAEVTELARRHPGCDIQTVDNILDLKYFNGFLAGLAERRRKVHLFYETKSNLKKDQVRLLRSAGVVTIQPGIESFSDDVLKLMRKGVTGLQNIQLLKWCKELGVEPSWNLIWGFPGESPQDYEDMARLVPLLSHLPPPVVGAKIRLDRFSPNFVDAERLGFADVKPLLAYDHIYRLPDTAVANLACYFRYEYAKPQSVDQYTRRLAREIEKWTRAAKTSELLSIDVGEHMVIVDTRPVSRTPLTVLGGLVRHLYRECDSVRDRAALSRVAASYATAVPALEAVEPTLAPLVERGLLLRDGSRYLALAIPLGEYTPSRAADRRFAAIVRSLGLPHEGRWVVPMADVVDGVPRDRARKGKVPHLARARFSVGAEGELIVAWPDNAENRVKGEPHGDEERTEGKEEDEAGDPQTDSEAKVEAQAQG